MPKYIPADEATLCMARELIADYHPWLKNARIAVVLREGEPPKSGGKRTLGAASLVDAKTRALASEEYDFFIWLCEEWWADARDEERRALLDHELCHCWGEPLAWKMRDHDITEFTAIVQRHGLWYAALESFVRAGLGEGEQPPYQWDLSGLAEPAGKVGTLAGQSVKTERHEQ